MSKKLLAASAAAILLLSCEFFPGVRQDSKEGFGSLTATAVYQGLGAANGAVQAGAKVIRPTIAFELSGFDWVLTGPSGQIVQFQNQSSINDDSLETGVWNIAVYGENTQGVLIAEGFQTTTIQPTISQSVSVEVGLIAGKGKLKFELTWPPGILTAPSVSAYAQRVSTETDGSIALGAAAYLDVTLTAGQMGALYENADWDSGYYLLSVRLLENGETTWGIRESVYIVKGETSSRLYSLPGTSLKTRPAAPSALTIENYGSGDDGSGQIALTWRDNSDNEARFVMERRVAGESVFTELAASIDMDQTRCIDTALDQAKAYEYRIKTMNMWGSSEYAYAPEARFPAVVLVAATIADNQIWNAGQTYSLSGVTTVAANATLTIEPGTIVQFNAGAELVIEGRLLADGRTESGAVLPILFTANQLSSSAGSWRGLSFTASSKDDSILRECRFAYGQSLRFTDAHPVIDNIDIDYSGASAYSGFSYCAAMDFTYTTDVASVAEPYTVKNVDIDGCNFGVRLSIAATVKGGIALESVAVKNANDSGVWISNPTAGLSLVIDDAEISASGNGLRLDASNPTTVIENGSFHHNSTGIKVVWTAQPQNGLIKSNSFANNGNHGLHIALGSEVASSLRVYDNQFVENYHPIVAYPNGNAVTIAGNTIESNNCYVYITGGDKLVMHSNIFQGNRHAYELMLDGALSVKATYNYWGSSDINVIRSRIYDRYYESWKGEVQFQPFLTEPGQYLKPVAPASGALVPDYGFSFGWESYKRPDAVEFTLARNPDLTDAVWTSRGDYGYSLSLPAEQRDGLVAGTTYYWKVGSIGLSSNAVFSELSSFTVAAPGIDLDLSQFQEALVFEGLAETLYLGNAYAVDLVSAKTAASYRWSVNGSVVQESASSRYIVNTSDLGPGTYTLSAIAVFGNRSSSLSSNFTVLPMRVAKVWALPYGMVVKRNDDSVVAWGYGYKTAAGSGNGFLKTAVNYPTFIDYQVRGESHYWLRSDGSLWTAGNNDYGQLGIGSTSGYEYTPRKIMDGVAQFAIGGDGSNNAVFGLALKTNGGVYAWGCNDNGRLGIGTADRQYGPRPVPLGQSALQVSAGNHHALTLLADGSVVGWGYNGYRALGQPTPPNHTEDFLNPITIPGVASVVKVIAGNRHSFFLDASGRLLVCGHGHNLGLGNQWDGREAVVVVPVSGVVDFALGWNSAYAKTSSGRLYSWGYNEIGETGLGSATWYWVTPQLLAEGVTAFGAGWRHAWYVDERGAFWVWGANGNGQCAVAETMGNQFTPILVRW